MRALPFIPAPRKTFTVPSVLSEVDGICLQTREWLDLHGQSDNRFALDLLLREFLCNAIIHGNRSVPSRRVRATVSMGRRWITLTVEDEGHGFDWRSASRTPPDHTQTSGRGLPIGAQYSDRMRFNRRGNRVTLWVRKAGRKETTP